jgi:hypothetical protein
VKPPRRDTRALSPAGMCGGKAPLRLAAQKSRPRIPSAYAQCACLLSLKCLPRPTAPPKSLSLQCDSNFCSRKTIQHGRVEYASGMCVARDLVNSPWQDKRGLVVLARTSTELRNHLMFLTTRRYKAFFLARAEGSCALGHCVIK